MGSCCAMSATNRAVAVLRAAGYKSENHERIGQTVEVVNVYYSQGNDVYEVREVLVLRLPDGSTREIETGLVCEYSEGGVLGCELGDLLDDPIGAIEATIEQHEEGGGFLDDDDVRVLREEIEWLREEE